MGLTDCGCVCNASQRKAVLFAMTGDALYLREEGEGREGDLLFH